jgi:hypothetical protein
MVGNYTLGSRKTKQWFLFRHHYLSIDRKLLRKSMKSAENFIMLLLSYDGIVWYEGTNVSREHTAFIARVACAVS